MIHRDFVLKVGDLLRNPGRLDELELEGVMLEDIEGLTEEGFSALVTFQGVDDHTVTAVINQGEATITELCDLSGEEYQRQVKVDDFRTRFAVRKKGEDIDGYDESFTIDLNNESIDVYDFLVQSIRLQEPVVHIKPGKEYLLDKYEDDNSEPEKRGNIRFH